MAAITYVMTTMVLKASSALSRVRSSERGQDLIEYALLSGLIGMALLAAFTVAWGTGTLGSMATEIKNCLDFKQTTNCDITV